MSVITMLSAAQKGSTSDDQGPWRQFILDHLDYIANQSTSYPIAADAMYKYKYDLRHFLKVELTRQNDIAWIVLLLNNMGSDFEFVEPGTYVIPTDDLIQRLYLSYVTISSNVATS